MLFGIEFNSRNRRSEMNKKKGSTGFQMKKLLIHFKVLRCPHCQSKSHYSYRSDNGIQSRECRECQTRFRVVNE